MDGIKERERQTLRKKQEKEMKKEGRVNRKEDQGKEENEKMKQTWDLNDRQFRQHETRPLGASRGACKWNP